MRLALALCVLVFVQLTTAQEFSPEMRKTINEAYNIIREYEVTTPQWKKKYDWNMLAGNYKMKNGEYANAIKNFNTALSIVPNSQEALIARNYCRSMLPKKTQSKRKSTLQRY